ncbi:hypothetical protein ABZY57_22505 [Streptomyces sp. NPDC006450]|uniref:hypothetical protein n=1 Tax=Streptomyces sp. NPDC006450 TaxID=3155458 RepID=UPI0033A6A703
MAEYPGFGAMLACLLDRREVGAQEWADRAELSADEVRAVLAGDGPGEELLRRLAPPLGFHAVDLFILAGLAVPDDMAPLDAAAAMWVGNAARHAARLPAGGRRALLQVIRSMPQEERRSSFVPKPPVPLVGGPGAGAIRMLQYRNLNWSGMARTLASVTPTYLSAATYGAIGSGRKELTPALVRDIAVLLGIDARDLAVLTGVILRAVPPPPTPEAVDTADLLWEARRLSTEQARQVSALASSMRENSPDAHLMELPDL